MTGSSDRGQAYTLEALIAALLLVTAVLFALQAVVITPTSAGNQDRDVQAQRIQVASDLLSTAANDGELSRMARYWDCDNDGFAAHDEAGVWVRGEGYPADLAPVEDLSSTLNATFDAGTRYNLELVYTNATGPPPASETGDQNVTRIVYQGTPGDHVVTATHTVTLTDGQAVTGRDTGDQTLGDCDSSGSAPIPDAHTSSSVYNVVEVRLVLW